MSPLSKVKRSLARQRRDRGLPYRDPNEDLFPSMVRLVPPGKCGTAEIVHHTVTKQEAVHANMMGRFGGGGIYEDVRPGRYAVLRVGRETMMSDTRMERITNAEFIRRAEGHILIGGLGLGMLLHGLAKGPRPLWSKWTCKYRAPIKSVTVVEQNADVIALIERTLPKKLPVTLVAGDIFTYVPPKGVLFDTIYFDIWANVCSDNLQEMGRLHRRYSHWLNKANPRAWSGSWRRDCVRALKSRGW